VRTEVRFRLNANSCRDSATRGCAIEHARAVDATALDAAGNTASSGTGAHDSSASRQCDATGRRVFGRRARTRR
jgi:hypothetical protein